MYVSFFAVASPFVGKNTQVLEPLKRALCPLVPGVFFFNSPSRTRIPPPTPTRFLFPFLFATCSDSFLSIVLMAPSCLESKPPTPLFPASSNFRGFYKGSLSLATASIPSPGRRGSLRREVSPVSLRPCEASKRRVPFDPRGIKYAFLFPFPRRRGRAPRSFLWAKQSGPFSCAKRWFRSSRLLRQACLSIPSHNSERHFGNVLGPPRESGVTACQGQAFLKARSGRPPLFFRDQAETLLLSPTLFRRSDVKSFFSRRQDGPFLFFQRPKENKPPPFFLFFGRGVCRPKGV